MAPLRPTLVAPLRVDGWLGTGPARAAGAVTRAAVDEGGAAMVAGVSG
jgi:hypothetical protein